MTFCYVKRLCNNFKKLIRLYKNGQTIKNIITFTNVRVLRVFHLLLLFFLDKIRRILSLFVYT